MSLGPDDVRLRDRIAIVTGAAIGLGAAIAATYAQFLAGDLPRFVTGTTLHVDGGNFAVGGWRRLADGRFEP